MKPKIRILYAMQAVIRATIFRSGRHLPLRRAVLHRQPNGAVITEAFYW